MLSAKNREGRSTYLSEIPEFLRLQTKITGYPTRVELKKKLGENHVENRNVKYKFCRQAQTNPN